MFFDAGNTLLFPDTERTLASLIARGIRPTDDHLRTAEKAVREYRDHHTGNSNPNHSYWNVYFDQLFSTLGLAPDPVLQTTTHRLFPSLHQLAAHIAGHAQHFCSSNSNTVSRSSATPMAAFRMPSPPRVSPTVSSVIIDSAHVGVEKPDPAIFRTGLDAMQVQPSESVYVGDVYAIDVLGARSVGMRAILIDPFGVYDHQDCPHISSLSELPDLLRLLNEST